MEAVDTAVLPTTADSSGFEKSGGFTFGRFGGRYVPETLVAAHEELWEQYQVAMCARIVAIVLCVSMCGRLAQNPYRIRPMGTFYMDVWSDNCTH